MKMSYRELRNFAEMLRTLGYRRLISYENFRTSNFHLVSDILIWLVARLDPDYTLSKECSTMEQRVALIHSVAEFMVLKMGLKLNMKKLYQADGHAVQEMLKCVTFLYNALKLSSTDEEEVILIPEINDNKVQELKLCRELSAKIVVQGSALFESLNKEPLLRESRNAEANSHLDAIEMETFLREAHAELIKTIERTKQSIENISATESSLHSKIAKKLNDLERMTKRFEILQKVRPAYLDEFEQIERNLNVAYDDYVVRFRCYTFLQQQLQHMRHREEQAFVKGEHIQEDSPDDKSVSLEDGSVSKHLPEQNKEMRNGVKRPTRGRLRTATATGMNNKMHKEAYDKDDSDIDDLDEEELLDGDLLLNNDDTDNDSNFDDSDSESKLISNNKRNADF